MSSISMLSQTLKTKPKYSVDIADRLPAKQGLPIIIGLQT